MRKHDWMTLALIGACALPSVAVTSVLALRLLDSRASGNAEMVEASHVISGPSVLRFNSDMKYVRPATYARPVRLRFTEGRSRHRNAPRFQFHLQPELRFLEIGGPDATPNGGDLFPGVAGG